MMICQSHIQTYEDDIVELITVFSMSCDAKYGYIYLSGIADSILNLINVSEITYSINWNAEDYTPVII